MLRLKQVLLSCLIVVIYCQCILGFHLSSRYLIINHRASWKGSFQSSRSNPLQLSKDWTQLAENKMSIDEIKSELELRNIDYRDCISRRELVEKLVEARATGKADPQILEKFNEQVASNDIIDLNNLDDEKFDQVKANDGGVPGGLDAQAIKTLVSNPKILQLLKDPKMQEMMRTVMTGGQEAFKKKYVGDPDARILIDLLNETIMGTLNKK